jgi:phosphatidylethanolamine-binding protein
MANTTPIKSVLASSVPTLTVSFPDNVSVKEPGQHIPRQSAQVAPKISFPSAVPGKKYFVINLDLDAPFVSLPILGPILHWIQYDLTVGEGGVLEGEEACSWIAPRPPLASGPHRYVFALFEQPETLEKGVVAPEGGYSMGMRIRYDFAGLEKKIGLGEVLGGNWFTSK